MPELQWDVESRIGRIRQLAGKVYEDVTLPRDSVREVMHALALATATVIKENFPTSRGAEAAINQHLINVRHHARKP